MTALVRLGLRLSWGTPGQRGRSALVVLATALGALAVLATLQVAAARIDTSQADPADLRRLVAAIVGAVVLPVVALAGTVARLSASVRDRRLANLRMLGLAPGQTRLVAVVEAGVAAVVGTLLGVAAYAVLRPLLPTGSAAGRGVVVSLPLAMVVVALALPLVTVAIGVLPVRLDTRRALDRARRRDARRPSALRALPVATGLVLCLVFQRQDHEQLSGGELLVFFAGVTLTGLGLVVVVPVFVRLVGDVMLRLARGPVGLVTARRLQAQPAGVTRVVAALMVGLFLVVGARSVLVAFEATPQYASADRALTRDQTLPFTVPAARATAVLDRVRAIDGVRRVVTARVLVGLCGPTEDDRCGVLVATCPQLLRMYPGVTGCRPGEVQRVAPYLEPPDRILVRRAVGGEPSGAGIRLPGPTSALHHAESAADGVSLLVPPTSSGVEALTRGSDRLAVVRAGPGRLLGEQLDRAGGFPTTGWDFAYHDYVEGLRTVIWSVAAVVLGLGLLTFAVAGIDRALARRRELASLQLVGVPGRILYRAQWLEAVLPTALGSTLAIVAGLFAGATYLAVDDGVPAPPWAASLDLLAVSLVASVVVASVTALGARTRIDADLVRAE